MTSTKKGAVLTAGKLKETGQRLVTAHANSVASYRHIHRCVIMTTEPLLNASAGSDGAIGHTPTENHQQQPISISRRCYYGYLTTQSGRVMLKQKNVLSLGYRDKQVICLITSTN